MKIGDKVRVKEDCKFLFWVGKKGIITEIDNFRECGFCVEFYNDCIRLSWFREGELELVDDSL